MEIRIAGQEDRSAWDSYVDNCPGAAPYSFFAWKLAIEEAYGHEACYLLAEEGGDIKGIFPFFNFRIPFYPPSIVSLPYCDVGDINADNQETRAALLNEALISAKKLNAKNIEIRSCYENLISNDFDYPAVVHTGKVRMLLELPDSSEELWNSFKSKLRSQINKSEKNGLIFSWGSRQDIDAFYYVFSRNMHDLGSPVHSKKWIEKIVESFGDKARMGLISCDGQPVGCGIILYTKHTVSIPWASTLRQYNHMAPNMMLYWNFLKFAADGNFKIFDFGRSTPNEGTFRFKKQWGASPVPLFWYQVDFSKNDRQTANDDKMPKREILANLWAKSPLFLANFLGPCVRRYISL